MEASCDGEKPGTPFFGAILSGQYEFEGREKMKMKRWVKREHKE